MRSAREPGSLIAGSSLVDPACPVNWSHPLSNSLSNRWLALPNSGWRGSTTWHDIVRGGHKAVDVTLAGTTKPAWMGRQQGSGYGALKFDGSTSYGSAAVNLSNYNIITVGFWGWANVFNNAASRIFLEYGNPYYNTDGWNIEASDTAVSGMLGAVGYTGGNYADFAYPTANAWHRFLIVLHHENAGPTVEYGMLAAWVDGQAQTINNDGTGSTSNQPNFGNNTLYFGSRGGSSIFNACRMDDVCLWPGRRFSAVEAQADWNEAIAGYPESLNWLTTRTFFFNPAAAVITDQMGWYARRQVFEEEEEQIYVG
jgi:hypothetical protein